MLVRESLSRFDLLNEDFLAENVLNEKFDINLLSNKAQKLAVLASMFVMFAGGRAPDLANNLDKKEIAKKPLIMKLADEDFLERDDIFTGFNDLLSIYKQKEEKAAAPKIVQADENFINAINKIKPGRLDSAYMERYNQYDDDILRAADNLRAKGEDPNVNLIKAIMLVETGMKPTKNNLGFEGFPQTKEYILNGRKTKDGKFHPGINQRYGTKFTMNDMYNAEKAAEFIHYYLKTVAKSDYVEDLKDMIIAYNWGVGNLGAYKRGEKELPKQSSDYVKMIDVMQDYFTS